MISVNATVVRDGQTREIPLAQLVPGDVVHLAAGDMIPADLRLISCKDLFVIQSSLTGESFPVEKLRTARGLGGPAAVGTAEHLFPGHQRRAARPVAVIVMTGLKTYLGQHGQRHGRARRCRPALTKGSPSLPG